MRPMSCEMPANEDNRPSRRRPAQGTPPDPLVVIVTGAHLTAEESDRPLAYHLRECVVRELADVAEAGRRVVVCSDVWYLNQDRLRTLPTISVGGPGVNALAAYLADRLPSVFAVDGVMVVQMGASAGTPVASLWGIDATATAGAVETFTKRFLDQFLDAMTVA